MSVNARNELKWIANGNVLGWSAFWVFGYLALTAEGGLQKVIAGVIAAMGLLLGLWAYARLMRANFRVAGPNAFQRKPDDRDAVDAAASGEDGA